MELPEYEVAMNTISENTEWPPRSNSERLFKRVCHLIHDDGAGGGPLTVLRHLKYYFRKYDIVLIHGGCGVLQEYCRTEKIRNVRLPIDRLWKCLWGWVPLLIHLRRLQPDLLILHGQWGAPLGSVVGKLAGVKRMIYISHWPAFYTDWDLYRVVRNRIAESIPVHLCDKTICISPENHYQYQIRFPRLQDKFVQICNPFDIEAPSPSGAVVVRRQFGWSEEHIHVVSVGRLSSQKHVEWLLESWLEVQKRVPTARLWIIGSGEDENHLHSMAVKLEIERTCTFLGAQKNGVDFINASDVVAMTSLYEGHSNVPMEAHLCGKPIVANSVDGVRVSITDGIDGFLVSPGDVAAFSRRLVELCESVEIRKRMGEQGKTSVLKFSVKIIMEAYSKLISDLIGE